MSEKPPSKTDSTDSEDAGGDSRVLNIENLHLHANEIDSLRRLAETDPELARIIVDQKDKIDAREHGSYRFGIGATVFLVLGVIVCLTFAVIYMGMMLSLLLLAAILAVALLIRVILTGEWSDTSWIGTIIDGLVRILGGRKKG